MNIGYIIIAAVSFGIFFVILAVLFLGFFAVIKAGTASLHAGNRVAGILVLAAGFLFLIPFSYLALGRYSKMAYSVLSPLQTLFYTGITSDFRPEIRENEDGILLAFDENGEPFTGIRRTYFDRLRLSPFQKVNGFACFMGGRLAGISQSPEEHLSISLRGADWMTEEMIAASDIPLPFYRDYRSILEDEIGTWGEYLLVDERTLPSDPDRKVRYALCLQKNRIVKREIIFHENGVIAYITPYIPHEYDEWTMGGGNYLVFDSLGYLMTKENWDRHSAADDKNDGQGKWDPDYFVPMDAVPEVLKEHESRAERLVKKLLAPERPDLLENAMAWEPENGNFDNFYLLFGGTPDYQGKMGIAACDQENYKNGFIPLEIEQGGIFASALSAGTLITTAAEDMVLYPEHEGVEFAVFLNQEEVCRFLYKNDKFYMDNGLYAISLLPADAETEEQESYMRQEQERLDRMLEEVLGRTDENAASPEGE